VVLSSSQAHIANSTMFQRHKLERSEGKSYQDAGVSDQMKALNKSFGVLHGVSSLLNLCSVLALGFHGLVSLARFAGSNTSEDLCSGSGMPVFRATKLYTASRRLVGISNRKYIGFQSCNVYTSRNRSQQLCRYTI
jgi:hypothetical protein